MKRVLMLSTMAGPEGVFRAGEVHEVEDGLAAGLLAGRYAELLGEDGPVIETAALEPAETAGLVEPVEPIEPIETATIEAPETAVRVRRRKKVY